MDMIIGNHDATLRNALKGHTPSLLLSDYKNINFIDRPVTKFIDNLEICFVPWICQDNEKECLDVIRDSRARVCMGHFPISGFMMHQGNICEDGYDKNMFSKFERTFSGHFHHRSTDSGIWYLGSPFQTTWADYNDIRGFHILDTDTLDLTFIENPYKIYNKIDYDDTKFISENFEKFRETYVKVIVINNSDKVRFDTFMREMDKVNPVDVKIVETVSEASETFLEEEITQADDTLTMLGRYVDGMDTSLDKDKLKQYLRSLYMEAIQVETNENPI